MKSDRSPEPGIEGQDWRSPTGGSAVFDRDYQGVGPVDNEDALREREGLPPDAVLLAVGFPFDEPPFPITVPMRMPEGVWAMDVAVADVCVTGDRAGLVELFAGCWARDRGRPAQASLGDVVLRLSPPGGGEGPVAHERGRVDVALWVAHRGRWVLVGSWPGQDGGWPRVVAPTVAAVMWLCGELLDHGLTEGTSGR
jgi:hypothetical protein